MSDNLADIVGGDVNPAPEPSENANPAPAANAEPVEPKDQPAEEPKMVPLQALHEERARIKQMRGELEAERKARAADMEKLQKRLEALARGSEPQSPAFEEDPARHLKHQLDTVSQSLEEQKKLEAERRQQAEQQAAWQQLEHQIRSAEAAFAQSTADYGDALKFLRESRVRELTDVYGLDLATANQRAQADMAGMAINDFQRGANPAETAYRLAALRGYKKANVQPSPQEKLDTQQRGAAAKTLGGGSAPQKGLSIEALAAMSEEEFGKLTQEQWRKAMGG